MACAMAEAGATVILNGRDRDLLEKRRKELEAQGFQVDTEAFDVAETENAIAGIQAIADRHGGLDGLVNNPLFSIVSRFRILSFTITTG